VVEAVLEYSTQNCIKDMDDYGSNSVGKGGPDVETKVVGVETLPDVHDAKTEVVGVETLPDVQDVEIEVVGV